MLNLRIQASCFSTLPINVLVVFPPTTSESKWLHSFGQDDPSADPIWTTIKTIIKCSLVLTPSLILSYNNSFTDPWPLFFLKYLLSFVSSRLQQIYIKLQMNITRCSTRKSDWLYSLQPKMEKLYTVNQNKTGSWCSSDHELLIAKFRLK